MKVSFVSSQAISNAMRYQMTRMQAELVTANKEAVTWRVADRGLALGARTGAAVSIHREIDRLEGLKDSNALAASRLTSTQVVMRQVTDEANQLLSALTTALSGSGGGKVARDDAAGFLKSMTGSLNSHLNGEHLFAGINTDVTPLNDFSDPNSANRLAFEASFDTHFGFPLGSPQMASITPAQMEDFVDNVVTPQFMGADWNDNWSSATDQQIVSRITLTETAPTSVSANIPAFRKFAMASAMAVMLGEGMPAAAENVILEKSISLIGEGVTDLANQQGYTGIVEQRISRANERMSMQVDIFKKSLIDLEGIDETEAATKVNGLVAQLEISFALTARMQQMSLLKYL